MEKICKLKKIILISAAAMLCTMYTAYAEYIDNINYNFTNNNVEINGKFLENSNGTYATVLVLKPGGDIENLDSSLVEKQEQILIEDGKFSLNFELNNPIDGGIYTAFIKAGKSDKKSTFKFTNDISPVYEDIMSQTDEQSFAEKIQEYIDELVLSDTIYAQLSNKNNAGKIAYENRENIKDAESLKNSVITASYIQALNENKILQVCDNTDFIDAELLGLDKLESQMNVTAYTLYTGSITDEGKEKVLKNIQGKNYESIDDFISDFIYQSTISAIKYNISSGTAHIKDILKNNNSKIGFDLKNYNSVTDNSIDLLLLKGNEWEKEDIQDILNTKSGGNDDSRGDVGGNSTGGGGTSGGVKPSGNYSQDYSVKPQEDTEIITFNDITPELEWAREAIEKLAQLKIINGRENGIFAPKDNVTRAEFLKMVLLTLNIELTETECEFLDVKKDDWYYEYVASAFNMGIVKGYDNGYFGASDSITRQDASVIILNAITFLGRELPENTEEIEFSDKTEISDYAIEAVENLTRAGIIQGSDNLFMPLDNCTRAQAAVMLNNIINVLGEEGDK